MEVSEALARRFTCRAFLPKAVPGHAVEHVLRVAGRAPSAGNVQPWQVWALAGAPLEALKARVRAHTCEGQLFETAPEYTTYPEEMGEPYATRRFRNGEAWYGALHIARDDHTARMAHVAENFELCAGRDIRRDRTDVRRGAMARSRDLPTVAHARRS